MNTLRTILHFLKQLALSDPGDRLEHPHERYGSNHDMIQYSRITDLR
jgi:hypothetical protein